MTPVFFDILAVVKGQKRGGMMDLFRLELQAVKEAAAKMGSRPRLVSGGGDGTASFALFIVFKALQANPDRADEGLADTGNGFIWTNDEMETYFPALAQLPLGSANDLGNILGWGQKYPGDASGPQGIPIPCRGGPNSASGALHRWFSAVIDPKTRISNFDCWGMMPEGDSDSCDFKICELATHKNGNLVAKVDGKGQLAMQPAGLPVPFLICLYFGLGLFGYVVSRFQLNRHETPIANRLEYVKQFRKVILGSSPPQLQRRNEGLRVDCDGKRKFPTKDDKDARNYREVGFLNINWMGHGLHGSSDGACCRCAIPDPVRFDDGQMDFFVVKGVRTFVQNPGTVLRTSKQSDMHVTYTAPQGKGIFFQYDGEARFAFHPDGKPFSFHIRRVIKMPVVIGPFVNQRLTGKLSDGPVKFEFCGDTPGQVDQVRKRIFKFLKAPDAPDGLASELLATKEELAKAGFPLA
mmetsp:Transcript_53191/g.121563  ORF Transcript_53191/g.121563 Transcript_53191/m.121563 type:complete len:466 (-) Transcript_53191:556-1953(-)